MNHAEEEPVAPGERGYADRAFAGPGAYLFKHDRLWSRQGRQLIDHGRNVEMAASRLRARERLQLHRVCLEIPTRNAAVFARVNSYEDAHLWWPFAFATR